MMKVLSGKMFLSAVVLLAAAMLRAEPPVSPPNGGPGSPAGRPGPRAEGKAKNFRRRPPKAFFSKLTEEERQQLDRLVRSGQKDELRKLMRELMYKYRPDEIKNLEALSVRYLKTKDEKEREAIRAEMKTVAGNLFRKRQEFTRNNIAETEKQLERAQQDLERLKQYFQNREKQSEQIIDGYVKFWCLSPDERKKMDRRPDAPPFKHKPPHPPEKPVPAAK